MPLSTDSWQPKTVVRFIASKRTGASVVIVDTDCGEGYLKGLGNEGGPHVLACELVGSLAADWLGLPTLDFGIVNIDDIDELPLAKGGLVKPGPAFISRQVAGFPWGGDSESLEVLSNKEDLTKLVILDTWILNCDRYCKHTVPPRINKDNVFLTKAEQSGALRLIAMDHTHAFTCGHDLTPKLGNIANKKNGHIFGFFPEFLNHWNLAVLSDTLSRLGKFDLNSARLFVETVPLEWEVSTTTRLAWAEFLVERAQWLAAGQVDSWLAEI